MVVDQEAQHILLDNAAPLGNQFVRACGLFFVGDTFEPFHHAEHHSHRYEADGKEESPGHPDGILVIDQRANPEDAVANGGSTEPKTLAETLKMFRSDFRHEGESDHPDLTIEVPAFMRERNSSPEG